MYGLFTYDQFLALCTYDCGIPHRYSWATYCCCIFWNSWSFTRTKPFEICVYILQAKLKEKKGRLVMNCTNSDRPMVFLTREKWASDHCEKKQEQIWPLWLIKDSAKCSFFMVEVLHIRSTFSSCHAVSQISWSSKCLLTQRYKRSWVFIPDLYNVLQCNVRKI